MKIPFNLMPGSWGLKGKTKQRAEAEYYLSGYSLAKRIAEIDAVDEKDLEIRNLEVDKRFKKLSEYEFQKKLVDIEYADGDKDKRFLELDRKWNKISEYDYQKKLIMLDKTLDELERNIEILELDKKYFRIDDFTYQRKMATLKNDFWLCITNVEIDPNNIRNGSFTFDFNDAFVAKLIEEGYKGADDMEMVDNWFIEICKNVLRMQGIVLMEDKNTDGKYIKKEKLDDEEAVYE